jgi:hypothetical protein
MRFEHQSLRQGLVGAWCPSLGASGLSLIDRSGRNNHGTLVNMAGQDNWRASGSGVALDFDGTNDHVVLSPVLSGRPVLTVTFWARPTSTSSRIELAEGTNSTIRAGYAFSEDGNAYLLPGSTAGFGFCNWSSRGVARFIHYAGVFDSTAATNAERARIFLNGVQQTLTFVGTIPTTATVFTGNLLFGLRPDFSSPSSGLLDDIRIYNRALTPAEIRLLASRRGIGLLPLPDRAAGLPRKLSVNVGGTWRPADAYVHDGTAFRLSEAKINVGGVWK